MQSKTLVRQHPRHVFIYKLLRILVRPIFKLWLGYKGLTAGDIDQPCIILANHNTNLDPVFVTISFPQQMYFVASEHIYRWGFASKLLSWCFAPIARAKGTTDARTVMEVLSRIHAGYNVCIFAEGNRSFNGLTSEILPSTGKLVKASGAMLVTYMIEGGYFTSPRWSRSMRRGKMTGYVVGKYSAAALKEMSAEQVSELIERDLNEDAYKRQKENPIYFRGKHLAEHLETALYLCPSCEKIGTIKSHGDRFSCECGLNGCYSQTGELVGDIPFKSITAWDIWQSKRILDFIDKTSEDPLFIDTDQQLYRVHAAQGRDLLTIDTAKMYCDRLVCGSHTFPIHMISNMSIYSSMALIFTTSDGGYYELISNYPRSATKYLTVYRALKQ